MHSKPVQVLSAAALTMLRPLVRIFLRNGIGFKVFAELVKQAYVEVANAEFRLARRKSSISRVAILTGLTRREVRRQLNSFLHADGSTTEQSEHYNRAARVVTGWVRDPHFNDGKGHPIPLPLEGGRASFSYLVKCHSGDIPVRAMLDELVRVGAVQYLKDGRLRLRSRAYIPEKSPMEKLSILGSDTADLITTIEHNLYKAPTKPRFQRKLMYNNVPVEAAQKFHVLATAQGQKLLETLDRWLSRHDRDINPSTQGTGRVRLGIGIYHFEERLESESEGESNVR